MADRAKTEELIGQFFKSLEVRDIAGAMARIGEEIIHDTPYGDREIGWETFERFLIHRSRCYRTEYDAVVVMVDASGRRAAAEFAFKTTYIADDDRLGGSIPTAKQQVVSMQAGMFFEIDEDRISRLTFAGNMDAFRSELQSGTTA